MSYNPTQADINILSQSYRTVYARFELFNKNMKMIGVLDGVLISDRYVFDANATSRKTASLSLYVNNSSITIGNDTKIWFDKYIRLNIGIYDISSQEIHWYRIGTFVYVDAGYHYSATERRLDIELVDRMAEFDGTRNGIVAGLSTKFPADTPIRDAMVSIVTQLGGLSNYRINIDGEIPYDLEFGTGSTISDMITKLRDLNVGYETFFDDDVFICQRYPNTTADPIVLDDSITRELIISETINTSFSKVYNTAEVWGRCLDADTYTSETTYANKTYTIKNDAITELRHGTTVGFKASANNQEGALVKINSFQTYKICHDDGTPVLADKIKADKSYVLRYKSIGDNAYFYLLGEYQICAVAKIVAHEPTAEEKETDVANNPTTNIVYIIDPSSPYCVDYIGEIRAVYSGGEYDNIYSEDLAAQRAKYELWLSSDMKEELSLTMVDIPWLEVNQKIEYTSLNTGVTEIYMIKQKDGSTTDGVMNLSCVKFKPRYSWE